jgi:hypothetical protein
MCTVVVLRRPGHSWPLILAANRDERIDRPWRPPARHWPERSHIVAGIDVLAGGTWLGVNDYGLVAAILNRPSPLGPSPHHRSRGELPLEALEHAEAAVAVRALAELETRSYRTFNMVIADSQHAFWLRSAGGEDGRPEGAPVEVTEIETGISMVTAHDLNDRGSPRIRFHLPRFAAAAAPDPDGDDWSAWQALLASGDGEAGQAEASPTGALNVAPRGGFGTVCSSLIALPRPQVPIRRPVWRFAAGRPDAAPFVPLDLEPPPSQR